MSHFSKTARLALSLALVGLSTTLSAQQAGDPAPAPVGPALAAASNLSQGRQPDVIRLARALGVDDFRDGMNWGRAETSAGAYAFDDPRTGFPAELSAAGVGTSIVLNWGNPLYDDGDTPHSPEAVAAFGSFAAELVTRFDAVESLEIGNEFNGRNFVKGPLKDMSPAERARAYVPLLAAAAEAAREQRPGLQISGGATHSIAAGYLWEVLDAGGDAYLDSLAIHPYTTPAEQLQRQFAVLRRHPKAAELPIEVTEFGTPDTEDAAAHFLRNYCQFALSGVTRAAWYPLNARDDGFVPLFMPNGRITPAGRAYKLIGTRMEGRPVTDAAQDPFSYGCDFDGQVLVLWGAPRDVTVPPGTEVLDAAGVAVSPPYRLDPAAPLVFIGHEGGVTLADTDIVADSFDQFAFPEAEEARAANDAFERFARLEGEEIALPTQPGQERAGTPWYPYRGNPGLYPVRLTAETMLPGRRRDAPVEIVHRYVAPRDMTVTLSASFDVADRSKDGISVRVTHEGALLAEEQGAEPIRLEQAALTLSEGDRLEVSVGPNGSAEGELTDYRITLRAE